MRRHLLTLSKPGLALNDGTVDGNGSNARVLTQLVPKTPALDPSLPSIAEAIAVMAGSTLLQSTKDAPFVEFFVSDLSDLTGYYVTLIPIELHGAFQHHRSPRPKTVVQCPDRSTAICFRWHSPVPTRLPHHSLRSLLPQPTSSHLLHHTPRLVRRSQRAEQPLQPGYQQPAKQGISRQLRRRTAREAVPLGMETAGGRRACLHGKHGSRY